jgi:chromosome segregation ATPase
MAEEQQDNSSLPESDLDVAAKKWENELTLESGEELPTDEDNQLTQPEPEEEELEEGSEEEEADEEYEAEEEEEDEELHEVKSDGQTHRVSLQDLKDSFSKGQNYTRKSQALAEESRELVDAKAEASKLREQAVQALEFAQQQQPQTPEQTDEYWANLRESDPVQYLVERDGLRDVQTKNAERAYQLEKLQGQQDAERGENLNQFIEEQKVELLKLVPEWKDSKLANAEKKLVMEYGKSIGFTKQELDQAYDSRAVATMRKAALWDQLQTKKGGIKPVRRQSMKPGSKSGDPGRIKQGKAAERLKQSGRVEDAAGVFYNIIRSK